MHLEKRFALRSAIGTRIVICAAVMITAAAVGSVGVVGSAYAQCSGATPVTMTFKNQNSYPVWLADTDNTGTIAVPSGPGGKGASLEIAASSQIQVCTSSTLVSGTFWARTECNFQKFDADPDYVDCNSSTDCSSSHVCLGGKCMIDCSTPPADGGTGSINGTNGNCSALSGSVCVAAAGSAPPKYKIGSYCGFSGGVCSTGDCGSGLWQCQGSWDNSGEGSGTLNASDGPAPPASVFELTDAGANTTYDASNIGGYNTAVGYTVPTGAPISCAYSPVGCVSDLNASCPSLLQITEAPTATVGPISCGTGTYCQSGACVNNNTCVIGCTGPSKCALPNATSSLQTLCTEKIAGGAGQTFTLDGQTYTADGAEFQDMFGNVNTSGSYDPTNQGQTMISLDGGTYLCWGNEDCPPSDNCLLGAANGIAGFPSYVGICVNSSTGAGDQPAPADCTSSSTPTGQDCGQYEGMGAFTCVSASTTQGDACVPLYDSAIVGFGTFDSNPSFDFYPGVGGFPNPEWVYAALVASGGSQSDPWGTTPFYETFSNACPYEYQYPYDDHAGSFTCQTAITSAVTVTFGLSGPTATATATPTATATSSATASPTATSTASPTSTATPTATATASATATPTATPTATLTPTATATMTATATSSATPTATSTMTPTPTGTATPNCNLNFDLTASPEPLAFGDVVAKVPVTLPITITNLGELPLPVGTLSLSWKIEDIVKNGGASAFEVTGGTCTKDKKLKNNSSCTYKVRLDAKKSEEGKAVNAHLVVTGDFTGKVCPGHKQSVTATLAGFVAEPADRRSK